jgi:hypothetical protein
MFHLQAYSKHGDITKSLPKIKSWEEKLVEIKDNLLFLNLPLKVTKENQIGHGPNIRCGLELCGRSTVQSSLCLGHVLRGHLVTLTQGITLILYVQKSNV